MRFRINIFGNRRRDPGKYMRVSDLVPNQNFRWNNVETFGGYFIRNNDDGTTLVRDSGCDGKSYSDRVLKSSHMVFVDEDELLDK